MSLIKGEPTNEQLNKALDNVAQCFGISGAYSMAIVELRALRKLRTCWYGDSENKLRYAIDNCLKEASP